MIQHRYFSSASILVGAAMALLSGPGCSSSDRSGLSSHSSRLGADDGGTDAPVTDAAYLDVAPLTPDATDDTSLTDATDDASLTDATDGASTDLSKDAYLGDVPYGPLPVKINFQRTDTVTTPAGYLADTGLMFFDRGNGYAYGWDQDISSVSRERMNPISPDNRYDTLAQLQKDVDPTAFWEIAVPNGMYYVHIVSGDPNFSDGVFRTFVEGATIIDGSPTDTDHWLEGTIRVQVKDGRLTVSSATDAMNNKINFIEISTMPLPDAGPIVARDTAAPEDVAVAIPTDTAAATGDASAKDGAAAAKQDSAVTTTPTPDSGSTTTTPPPSTVPPSTVKKDAAATEDPPVDDTVTPVKPRKSSGGCEIAGSGSGSGRAGLLLPLLLGAVLIRRRRRG